VVIKPNLVMAHPRIATECYTRKEVIEGLIRLIRSRGDDVKRVDVVERSGMGVTTANMYRYAGYRNLTREYGVGLRAMEEGRWTRVVLSRSRIHPHITIAREMAERDFLIFVPKLKTNVLSQGYTGALKLNVGSLDGRERMDRHHRDLPMKIADILEAVYPDLIVTDGIRFSYGGNQMTQPGMDMGLLAVSTDPVAHDMVCASLLNLDPMKIDHIREAVDRGYGPRSLKEIEILGDFSPDRARDKTRGLDFGYMPVSRFPCPFRIIPGDPYCVGGCHGVFLDWLHMIRDRKPKLLKRFPRIPVVIGRTLETLEARSALLIGDCATASPNIRARRIVRIPGCPPTHKRIILIMMIAYGLLAPLVRPSLIIDGFILYPLKKLKGLLLNIRFRPGVKVVQRSPSPDFEESVP
jgi:uncharacterized protein (DUF362 family)